MSKSVFDTDVFYADVFVTDIDTAFVLEHNLVATRLLILMHVKHTVPYMYIQPSS